MTEDMETKNVGGKANSLIKLKENGIPVPEFFVIPASFYKKFLEDNHLLGDIQNLLAQRNWKEIKKIVETAPFAMSLENEIYAEFDKLDTEEVSVRSSAGNEDGASKSFAGQYETCLNVTRKNLLEAIKKCWSSLYDDNVISYTGIENFDFLSMNVVIQKMINPYCAGVAFSIDPVSKSENYSYIEACRGNGEKLVSGSVTPANYIVRRQTKKIDFHKGEDLLDDDTIRILEEWILKIEEIYGMPMDIEWCYLKNRIYILQARPITAFNKASEVLVKILTREKTLFEMELYYHGEYFGILSLTNNLYYQNPIFHFLSPKQTEIYYNTFPLEEEPNAIFRTLDENYANFVEKLEEVYDICKEVLECIDGKSFNVVDLIQKLITIQPFSTLGNMAGQGWKLTTRVSEKLFEYREKYDYIIYKSEEIISEYLKKSLPSSKQKYIPVLSIDDLRHLDTLDTETLDLRLKGFIYADGKILLKDFDEFCLEQGFSVKEELYDNTDIIKGNCAFSGKIKGIVKIIYSKEDFSKFQEGDIIVAPMTTPKYTDVMKIASGIITDEGGVTCHASIVARELKIPCLVGCECATKVLKDNMQVELDATNGIVKILS